MLALECCIFFLSKKTSDFDCSSLSLSQTQNLFPSHRHAGQSRNSPRFFSPPRANQRRLLFSRGDSCGALAGIMAQPDVPLFFFPLPSLRAPSAFPFLPPLGVNVFYAASRSGLFFFLFFRPLRGATRFRRPFSFPPPPRKPVPGTQSQVSMHPFFSSFLRSRSGRALFSLSFPLRATVNAEMENRSLVPPSFSFFSSPHPPDINTGE